MENIENIKDLLEKMAGINKEYADKLDASGGLFNEFEITIRELENPNSDFVAALLNPKGSHGQKHKFLECFIQTLVKTKFDANEFCFDLKDFNCEKADVETRYKVPEGELDIFIQDNKNRAIIIENKINHGDEPKQLKRYDKYAKRVHKTGNYQILYLTLDGKKASPQSGGGVNYLRISHEKTIIKWLEKCLDEVRHDKVRNAINQYIEYLKKLTNQDMDANKKEKIAEMIAGNPDFMEVAGYFSDNWNEIWEKSTNILYKKLENAIRETASKLKLEVVIDDGFGEREEETGAKLFMKDWKFHILFYWENECLYFGLDKNIGQPKKDIVQLTEKMADFNVIHDKRWIVVSEIEEWNEASWADKQKSEFKFVFEKTKAILDALNERNLA